MLLLAASSCLEADPQVRLWVPPHLTVLQLLTTKARRQRILRPEGGAATQGKRRSFSRLRAEAVSILSCPPECELRHLGLHSGAGQPRQVGRDPKAAPPTQHGISWAWAYKQATPRGQ